MIDALFWYTGLAAWVLIVFGCVSTRETKETLHNSGVRVIENTDENRVQLFFPSKPDQATRTMLKRYGFRWSPMNGAWQRHLNGSGIYAAKTVLEQLTPA